MAKLIVIEGLDGSGKATQARLLHERLEGLGEDVRKLAFPDYNNPSSSLVRMYLDGVFGDKPGDVNAYAASAFYAVDRYASYRQFWKSDYDSGKVILADRYATSNAIYQLAKIEKSHWDGFLGWLEDFEYQKLEIPQPDLVIYLDMPPDISQKLMSRRYGGDESKKDLHESNRAFLSQCRQSALYAAKRYGWKIISCAQGGQPRPIDVIGRDVLTAAQAVLTNLKS